MELCRTDSAQITITDIRMPGMDGIAGRHKGTIEVRSEVGQGTTITVRLSAGLTRKA